MNWTIALGIGCMILGAAIIAAEFICKVPPPVYSSKQITIWNVVLTDCQLRKHLRRVSREGSHE